LASYLRFPTLATKASQGWGTRREDATQKTGARASKYPVVGRCLNTTGEQLKSILSYSGMDKGFLLVIATLFLFAPSENQIFAIKEDFISHHAKLLECFWLDCFLWFVVIAEPIASCTC
jgi:hypothetical protein